MNIKDFEKKLLEVEEMVNAQAYFDPDFKPISIEFKSHEHLAGYFAPNPLVYREHPPYTDQHAKPPKAWYCEIYVNCQCVFREYHVVPPAESDTLPEYEQKVFERMLTSILTHGIMTAYRQKKELDNIKQGA